MNFKARLDAVARKLANKAIQKDTPYSESIDAFKELRSYYALTMKAAPPDEPEGNSFGGFQRAVQEATERKNGGREIRNRRGDS